MLPRLDTILGAQRADQGEVMLNAGSMRARTRRSWAQNNFSLVARVACVSACLTSLAACEGPTDSVDNEYRRTTCDRQAAGQVLTRPALRSLSRCVATQGGPTTDMESPKRRDFLRQSAGILGGHQRP